MPKHVRALAAALLTLLGMGRSAQGSVIWGNNASGGNVNLEAFDSVTGLLIARQQFLVPNLTARSDNGRGVALLGNTIYYTTADSGNIYVTDALSHADLGILVDTGFAGIANVATDGTFIYVSDYQSSSGIINKYDTAGNLVGSVVVGPGFFGRDGFEVQNNPNLDGGATTFISNRGDLTSPYDVYRSDGSLLVSAFINPSADGFGNGQTGIAYDGNHYFVSDILNNRLLEYDGLGHFVRTIDLSANPDPPSGRRELEDLSAIGNVVSNTRAISLGPVAGQNLVGTTHTVTATLSGSAVGAFVSGALIGFQITAGPNAGAAATCSPADCRTDTGGQVSFTYTDERGAGTDSLLAWDDMNENGAVDAGESRATAQETWLSSILPVHNPLNPGIRLQADGVFCADGSMPCATPFPSPGNSIGFPIPSSFEWQGTKPAAFVPGPTGATPTFLDDHAARAFVYASVDTEPGGTGEVNFYLNYDVLEPTLLPFAPGEVFTVQFDVAAGRFAGRMVVDLHCADGTVMVSGVDNGVPFANRPADQLGIEGACGGGTSPNPTGDPFFDLFTDVDGTTNGFNNPHPIVELEIPLTQNLGGGPRSGGGVYDPSPAFWSASDPPGPLVFSQNMIEVTISDGSTTLTPLPPAVTSTTTTTTTSTTSTTSTTTTSSSTSTTSTTTTSVTSTTIIPGNAAPDCRGAVADPAELWPPNHRFVDVSVVGVTDPDADPVTVTITGITQDEPPGTTCPDGTGVGTASASLRAERLGSGDGRVYHVSFTADDGRGGRCSGTVAVCVPHDQRAGHVCGDQGPLFDSSACP